MSKIVDEMIDLLRKERSILLNGDLERLERVQLLKSNLLEKLLHKPGHVGEGVSELTKLAKRNLHLLDGAKKGIRSARARFDSSSSDRILTTYCLDGSKRSISSEARNFERRA